ncbi:SDR family NAD(P)-dependent oxidoreductase [Ferrimonas balearica]|uniref:SDR family NAD(P)-dependent oxidoreductase n=1 Tax=Ferrimonas balearica TaxID=44012 RepID=UPI001C997E37|nr:SDR family NAD(P)-dependent oxidoreductase [Ferrimonas balearica]MBY5920211.1 SDR family NAD(P)-dependent oxidoreductase [Ferrimonas balearica]MBY5997104.1 SDR family NAD(P)-dependent oxidoreductase [Ferrimonas balearica]
MAKTILITGATDGIGLTTARYLAEAGHSLLIHGRNEKKLADCQAMLSALPGAGPIQTCLADLSNLDEVVAMASDILASGTRLDVLINNAGVYATPHKRAEQGWDTRFVVNALAPYLLARKLAPLLGSEGRVVNLSSAAQSSVELDGMRGERLLSDGAAYAQSKLALTMWSRYWGLNRAPTDPIIVAVNPGSLLGSKMVTEAFGIAGGDLSIGADIVVRAALSEDFANASGQYFDNDTGHFASPHPDALNAETCAEVVNAIEALLSEYLVA